MEEIRRLETEAKLNRQTAEKKRNDAAKAALVNVINCLTAKKEFNEDSLVEFSTTNREEHEILIDMFGDIKEPHKWITSLYMRARKLELEEMIGELMGKLTGAHGDLEEKVRKEIKSRTLPEIEEAKEAQIQGTSTQTNEVGAGDMGQEQTRTSARSETKRENTRLTNPRLESLQHTSQDVKKWFKRFEVQTRGWTELERGQEVPKLFEGAYFDEFEKIDENKAENYQEIKEHMIRNFQDNERNIFEEFSSAKQRPGEKFKDFVHRLQSIIKEADDDYKRTFTRELSEKIKTSCLPEIKQSLRFAKLWDLNTVEKIIQAGIEIEAKGTETSGLMEISEENEEVCAVSAQKKVCFSCNKKGHLANECKNKKETEKKYQICPFCSKDDHMALDCEVFKRILLSRSETNKKPEEEKKENNDGCSYCKKAGHSYEKCRKRLGLCLKCGEKGHMIKDCKKHLN